MEVTLRTLELSDAGEVLKWLSDERVCRFCVWEPYENISEAEEFIKRFVRPHPWFRAICVEGRAVGAVSVTKNKNDAARCRGEIGYILGSSYWGRGIGTAAVRLAAERVFAERPELERVEAAVDVENLASMRVLEKVGFQREGVMRKYAVVKGQIRDFVLFSLLATDLLVDQPNAGDAHEASASASASAS